jgi:hypothetical protein
MTIAGSEGRRSADGHNGAGPTDLRGFPVLALHFRRFSDAFTNGKYLR